MTGQLTMLADGVDLFIWGNAESTITIIAASIPILRVLIRDATHSRRYYKSKESVSKHSHVTATSSRLTGGSVIKHSSNLVVTISGGPPASQSDMRRKILNDGSKESMVLNGAIPGQVPGRIVRTNDFSLEYHHSSDRRDGLDSDEFEMGHV